MNDRDLQERAAALPQSMTPDRDLWPEIEAGLNRHEAAGRSWQLPIALAASLVLAVGIGYWAGRGQVPGGTPPGAADVSTVESAGSSGNDSRQASALPAGLPVHTDLHQTRRMLTADIEATLLRLPPDARVVVSRNLATISEALDEIDAVLTDAPSGDLNEQFLMSMYADQLALLGNMHSVISTSNQEILL